MAVGRNAPAIAAPRPKPTAPSSNGCCSSRSDMFLRAAPKTCAVAAAMSRVRRRFCIQRAIPSPVFLLPRALWLSLVASKPALTDDPPPASSQPNQSDQRRGAGTGRAKLVARNSGALYHMTYTQRVFYEFEQIKTPRSDYTGQGSTALGKDNAPSGRARALGRYPLARENA
jgi:hypothetical protein